MKLAQPQKIAESLRSDLEPYCNRIEVGVVNASFK